MLKLFKFRNDDIQTLPFGIFGAILIFGIVMCVEIGAAMIYYPISELAFAEQPVVQAYIMTIGGVLSKVLSAAILYQMYVLQSGPNKLYRYKRRVALELGEDIHSEAVEKRVCLLRNQPFSGLITLKGLLLTMPLILLMTLAYRVSFDSWIGELVIQHFPMDEAILETFEALFAVPWLGIFTVIAVAPVFEELFFRGFMMNGLRRQGIAFPIAALVSALLFAIMHLNIAQGINAFFLGLLCAFLYEKTGDLRAPIALHFFNNLFAVAYMEPISQWLALLPLIQKWILSGLGLMILGATLLGLSKGVRQMQTEPNEWAAEEN